MRISRPTWSHTSGSCRPRLSRTRPSVHPFLQGYPMSAAVCVISGVGPGTGSALAKRFAEGGYRVALLARSESRLAAVERELKNAKGYRCDVSDPAAVEAV